MYSFHKKLYILCTKKIVCYHIICFIIIVYIKYCTKYILYIHYL